MKNKNVGANPKKGRRKKRFNIILVTLLVFGVLALGFSGYTLFTAIYNKPVVNTPDDGDGTDNDESAPSSYEITPPDADEYYQNNATIISELDINDS